MLIQEIILENFMSYEYARIPFRSGVNVVCGPNGAGKSSILLGISVALGQSYTERSRKLSNLIRWGKDQARVTIVLDNSLNKDKRPVRTFNKDQIFLTRVLRRDGKYWFELDNQAATKKRVERILQKFSVDPDNILIIMHQSMTEQFTVLSPSDKLRTVEAAVGLESYRQNVSAATKKLSRILSEEESVGKLLESAEQTLNYWREQYDRYQQKKQLQIKKRFLERELAAAEASRKEDAMNELIHQVNIQEKELAQIEKGIMKAQSLLGNLHSKLNESKACWKKLFQERLLIERQKATNEAFISSRNQTIKEIHQLTEDSNAVLNECTTMIEQLEITLNAQQDLRNYAMRLMDIKRAYKNLESSWMRQLNQKRESYKAQLESYNGALEKVDRNISETKQKIEAITAEIDGLNNKILETRINIAVLNYQKEIIKKNLRESHLELKAKTSDYMKALKEAEKTGSRIASTRNLNAILDEIRLTEGHIIALADVSEDIERMYESYSTLYLDLKEKAQEVTANREKALEQVKARIESWQTVMQALLDHVSLQYQAILSHAQATGEVQLTNSHDLEVAGLEVLVGFKGAQPVPLNAYTQSGGERSMATMSFLLALQRHVQSSFRAVDEYDVHLDPRNRETITNLLIESVEDLNSQYLIITPSQITFAKPNVHIITVQNVDGASRVKEVV